MFNLLPHSKPCAWYYFDEKCSDKKIKESVACKQNKTPLYFQLHTPQYFQRFKREQMKYFIEFTWVVAAEFQTEIIIVPSPRY